MSDYLQAAATILSLINPVICASMFVALEGDAGASKGRKDAASACFAVFIILALAAFIGVPMLHVFGISLSAFQVAGGMVLTWMGFSLLRGPGAKADADSSPEGDSSLTPLILFAASPGTITGVITIVVDHGRQGLPLTALFGIAVAVAITLLMMLAAIRASGRKSGGGLMQSVGSRFMGLIVLSMGLQFALSGYKAFMAGGG